MDRKVYNVDNVESVQRSTKILASNSNLSKSKGDNKFVSFKFYKKTKISPDKESELQVGNERRAYDRPSICILDSKVRAKYFANILLSDRARSIKAQLRAN